MTETSKRMDVEARRQHIVDAASACARRSGFHGASMADIAKEAGLSVGQIYRYFDNKEAIIAAIVARDTALMRDKFAELGNGAQPTLDAILAKCALALDDLYSLERSALILEVVAEAARNPAVAAILQAADVEERQLQQDLLSKAMPAEWSERERLARGEVVSMLFEGMSVRGVNNPGADREAVAEVLRLVLHCLLREPLR